MTRAALKMFQLLQFVFIIQTKFTFKKATLFRKWLHSLVTCYSHNHTQIDTTWLDINTKVSHKKTQGFCKMQIQNRFSVMAYRIGLRQQVFWITTLIEKYAVSMFNIQGCAYAETWSTYFSPAFKTCNSAGCDVIREKCFYFAYSVQDINRHRRHEKDSSREDCSGYKSSWKTRKILLYRS